MAIEGELGSSFERAAWPVRCQFVLATSRPVCGSSIAKVILRGGLGRIRHE